MVCEWDLSIMIAESEPLEILDWLSQLLFSCWEDLYRTKWNTLLSMNMITIVNIHFPNIFQQISNEYTSEIILIKGGVPILAMVATSQHILMCGDIESAPLLRRMLRVPLLIYMTYLIKNIIDELNAWVSITKNPSQIDSLSPKEIIIITKLMWDTDENAITDFRSVVFKHVIPTRTEPITLTAMQTNFHEVFWANWENRINPAPPSFNRMPAKIMEPNTGASTWAKGSHKCTPYIGSFTKNPRVKDTDRTTEIEVNLPFISTINEYAIGLYRYEALTADKRGTDEIIV